MVSFKLAGNSPRFYPSIFYLVLLVTLSLVSPIVFTQEMVTNEELYQIIGGKAHDAMQDQREHLQNILDGFLSGNWNQIIKTISRMKRDIDRVADKYAAPPGKEITTLKALVEIRSQLDFLKAAAASQDYQTSHQHFVAITQQCMACHQVARSWGTFQNQVQEEASERPPSPPTASPNEIATAPTTPAELAESSEVQPEAVEDGVSIQIINN